jgi:hypothetical protein
MAYYGSYQVQIVKVISRMVLVQENKFNMKIKLILKQILLQTKKNPYFNHQKIHILKNQSILL